MTNKTSHSIIIINTERFWRKQTNENMEAEMKEMDEKPGKNAFSDDDNLMKRYQSKLE